MLPRVVPLLALVALVSAGCLSPKGNILQNAGFEEGDAEWFWLPDSASWLRGFEIVNGSAHEGDGGLRTRLLHNGTSKTAIVGAVQEITRDEMGGRLPERLTGWYRVDAWQPPEDADARAYAQVVLGLFPRSGARDEVCPGVRIPSPCQLSYPLLGITDKPFNITNRKFVFLGDGSVRQGEWIRFEMSPRADFEREWGVEPRLFHHAWLYLEVRYERNEGTNVNSPVALDIRWDDVYFGS